MAGVPLLNVLSSYWAESAQKFSHPHRAEIEAAIALNLGNCRLELIRIILDGSSEFSNCSHFERDILHLHAKLQTSCRAKFDCVDRVATQPSYFDMFNYAKAEDLREGIVILTNADIVFDESVELLKNLSSGVLLTIATRGLSLDTPHSIRRGYRSLIGLESSDAMKNLCDIRRQNSWDSWAFHPDDITPKSKNFVDGLKGKHFFMNEMASENSALHAIVTSSKRILNYFQACDHVHTWHFHETAKTHKAGSTGVRHKRLKAKKCSQVEKCLGS